MPSLHWIGKEKVIYHHADVPFKTLKHSYGFDNGQQSSNETRSENKIIHGNNLEAIKSLLPEYEGKKRFSINGFINHYPDFIIHTKAGKTIALETKGDHLYAENKIELGRLWSEKAGNDYRYFMAYDNREVKGAHPLDSFLAIIKNIN